MDKEDMTPQEAVEADVREREQERLEREIEGLVEDLAIIDASTPALQDRANAAQGKADKLKAKVAAADKREVELSHRSLVRHLDRGTALSERLQLLRSEGELDRRVAAKLATTERIGKLTDAVKDKKPTKATAKSQGFPEVYLAENGNFKPGYDARAKSDLINAVLGIDDGKALHKFSVALAQKLIDARDWGSFLERKQAIVEEKAAAKAKKAEEKAEAEKVKAAEKAAKGTASTAAPAADKGTKGGPDPKPQSAKRSGRKVGS